MTARGAVGVSAESLLQDRQGFVVRAALVEGYAEVVQRRGLRVRVIDFVPDTSGVLGQPDRGGEVSPCAGQGALVQATIRLLLCEGRCRVRTPRLCRGGSLPCPIAQARGTPRRVRYGHLSRTAGQRLASTLARPVGGCRASPLGTPSGRSTVSAQEEAVRHPVRAARRRAWSRR
jgi:hypothetical protein